MNCRLILSVYLLNVRYTEMLLRATELLHILLNDCFFFFCLTGRSQYFHVSAYVQLHSSEVIKTKKKKKSIPALSIQFPSLESSLFCAL